MSKNKISLEILVADLIQQLIDIGADVNDLIYTLTYYGYTDKEIKDYFGLPFDNVGE